MTRSLAAKSDVLVENFVPGKLEEFGLGYADLKGVAPGLIYCSVTGFGSEGPYREVKKIFLQRNIKWSKRTIFTACMM